MRSHLLEGTVRHRRSQTTSYALEHAVYYFALDLDELDEVTRRVPLIRRNRGGLVSFCDADHLPDGASDIARRSPRSPPRARASSRTAGRSPS